MRDKGYAEIYLRSGVFMLMDLVNSFISTYTCQMTPNQCGPTDVVPITTVGVTGDIELHLL